MQSLCMVGHSLLKLFRIDFETLVIADPEATTGVATDSPNVGDCNTDTLSGNQSLSPFYHCHYFTQSECPG